MPNFQKFSRRAVPSVKQPLVTFQRRGTLSLNHAAFLALGQPDAIELLYDPDEKIVGFHPTTQDDLDAYPVRRQQNSKSFLVAGNAFRQYFDINFEETRRYAARMIDDVLAIDLKANWQQAEGPRAHKNGDE